MNFEEAAAGGDNVDGAGAVVEGHAGDTRIELWFVLNQWIGATGAAPISYAVAALLTQGDRKIYFESTLSRADRRINDLAQIDDTCTLAFEAPTRVRRLPFHWTQNQKLSNLSQNFELTPSHAALIAPYERWDVSINELSKEEVAVLGEMHERKETPIAPVKRRMEKRLGNENWQQLLAKLWDRRIIGIYRRAI